MPLQIFPYLCGWVLVGPKGPVEHDDPILVQRKREGFWLSQPSTPRRVLDLRNTFSSQHVQILHVFQDQIKINVVFGNNCFTCGRGTRVTGGRGCQLSSFHLGVNLRCVWVLTLLGCLSCLSVLCLLSFCKAWCNAAAAVQRCQVYVGVCKTARAGQQGNSPLATRWYNSRASSARDHAQLLVFGCSFRSAVLSLNVVP